LFFPSHGVDALRIRKTSDDVYPGYARLESQGKLKERISEAYSVFEECRLCPRECGANRMDGESGFCRAPAKVVVYSAQPHYGEEVSLVGRGGSGTIFFSNCNLRCVFCQNWPIAHSGHGEKIEDSELADLMIFLQRIGCHNINLVTPTHVMPNILSAVRIACLKGLRLPLVYNTSGYERQDMIRLLDGIVDIYLPDFKYMDSAAAAKYSSGASDYAEMAKTAILEMHRQVGEHRADERGIARRGLMIRHLVMPNRVSGTEQFVQWVAETLTLATYVNLMAQYSVEYKAYEYKKIWRRITIPEYLEAMAWAEKYGLTNLDPDSIRVRNLYLKKQKEGARTDRRQ
jgi:putative pyruvate formate lyase activating enzyme